MGQSVPMFDRVSSGAALLLALAAITLAVAQRFLFGGYSTGEAAMIVLARVP